MQATGSTSASARERAKTMGRKKEEEGGDSLEGVKRVPRERHARLTDAMVINCRRGYYLGEASGVSGKKKPGFWSLVLVCLLKIVIMD